MQTQGGNQNGGSPNGSLRVAEFTALREEILKRLDLESQLVTLTLFAAGTVLTVGSQVGSMLTGGNGTVASIGQSALLVFPIVAMFLAASWAHHDLRIGQVRTYIRDQIEQGAPGWETYRTANKIRGTVLGIPVGAFAARGVFLSVEIIALVVALSHYSIVLDWDPIPAATLGEKLFIGADIVSLVLTVLLVRRRRRIRRR